jgi:broad specificity phosphatase PhoE
MKLLWVRHAQSIGNRQGQIQGQQESDLSEQGQRQAQDLAAYLALRWQPTAVYSSPLVRATQTAQILLQSGGRSPVDRDSSGLNIFQRSELQEINNGILQGLTWAEAKTRYPDLCQQLESTPEWLPIPGGETLQQVRDRCHAFISYLLSHHSTTDRLWMITHGGVLPFFLAALLESRRVWGLKIPPTALFEFELDLSRGETPDLLNPTLWQIHQFNTRPHLAQKAEGRS